MHNTGFFPDCHLLSLTNGSIWILYLARYSEIFKKPNFPGSKMEVHVHLKNAFQVELETEGSRLATIFGLPPTSHRGIFLKKLTRPTQLIMYVLDSRKLFYLLFNTNI